MTDHALEAARALAIRRFPRLAGELARKKDADQAEALLIAAYGLEAGARVNNRSRSGGVRRDAG